MAQIISAKLSNVNSAVLCHQLSGTLSNDWMRTVEEVRRARLQLLLGEHGTWARLNELTDKNKPDSTYSQIANQSISSKSGAPKQMGSTLARQLEISLKKPRGWMDTDPDLSTSHGSHTLPAPASSLQALDLAAALEVIGMALAADMPDPVREDVADALAKLASRRGADRDQQQVLHLLNAPPAKRQSNG